MHQRRLLDLFCGRGGWTVPALAAGWHCTGIDIAPHDYPANFIQAELPLPIPDILALRPTLVLASPPCEDYARHALPWIASPPANEFLLRWTLSLIDALPCPVIVECSRFAARTNPGAAIVGSYALWGAVPPLLPDTPRRKSRKSGTRPDLRAVIEPGADAKLNGPVNRQEKTNDAQNK